MADEHEISISTICGGGVPEVFQRELLEVLKNIADPNTAAERPRSMTLKFTFKPTEDRSQSVIDFSCRSSLQPVKMAKSQLFLSRHTRVFAGLCGRCAPGGAVSCGEWQ